MAQDKARLALVTGAAGGIGAAIARRLAEDGFRVLMTDMSAEKLAEVAKTIDGEVDHCAADITSAADRERLYARADGLFALVNNAGIFSPGGFMDLTGDDFRRMFEVNTVALFELSKLAVPLMRKGGGGRIVNIASRAYQGGSRLAHYAASKGAVVSLTSSMAIELGPDNILVNAIAPGVINTPILNQWDDPRILPALSSQQALGRIGQPEDIASVVSMMVSPRTDFLTGQTVTVDGGRAAPKLN